MSATRLSLRHPLDPLTEQEIVDSAALLHDRHGVGEGWRFASIELQEPSKEALGSWTAQDTVPRVARIVCWELASGETFVALVDLVAAVVGAFDLQPGRQANMTTDEAAECDRMLRAHPDVVEVLRRRGITDLELVYMDTWTYGDFLIPQQYKGRRVAWTDTWLRTSARSNPYAGPVDGLHCIVDLNAMELLEIHDAVPSTRPPDSQGEYLPELLPGLAQRSDVRPLEVTQFRGPSFTIEGRLLRWQKWSVRVGFNHREGLVLHTLSYDDDGRERSIAHRLSIAEMVVPYRDPSNDHQARTAFDVGEWGLGFMTTSLALGCDCLGEIAYLDAVVHDSRGRARVIPNAICIHEEDDRVLWKHVDPVSGAEVRRSRRLVISSHVTVANYEYLLYWSLYQDGTIEFEARATGIMVVSHLDEGVTPEHGTVVADRTYAPYHQHFLVARLDMDVDGRANTVYTEDCHAVPIGPDNPSGLALRVESTPLRTEAEGIQDTCWQTRRTWKVASSSATNAHGAPTAYMLAPTSTFPAMFDPASPVLERARVIGHTLWVSAFDPDERWPCGEFVNQSSQDEGLTRWVERDRPIQDADVVLWYVFGIHHITRPEDWPVMPVDKAGFSLRPFGFFDRNPALDVPPASTHGQACAHGDQHSEAPR